MCVRKRGIYPSAFHRSIFHPSTQLHIYVYDAQTDTHTRSLSLSLTLSHSLCLTQDAVDYLRLTQGRVEDSRRAGSPPDMLSQLDAGEDGHSPAGGRTPVQVTAL